MRSTAGARVAVPARFSQPVGDRLPNVACAIPRNGTQFAPSLESQKSAAPPSEFRNQMRRPGVGRRNPQAAQTGRKDERTCGSGVGGATVATSNVAYCHDNTLLKTTSLIGSPWTASRCPGFRLALPLPWTGRRRAPLRTCFVNIPGQILKGK
jgi:hypothetical protein